MIRYYLLIALCLLLSSKNSLAQDAIIFRDGQEKSVKIIQTNNDKTVYRDGKGKDAVEQTADNRDIFMLKFKTRGNVVFNERGERISSTSSVQKIPQDAIIVYYKDGREVAAYNLNMDAHTVSFNTEKKNKGRMVSASKDEIFLVKYPDGTRDVLVDLSKEHPQETTQPSETTTLPADSTAAEVPENLGPSVEHPIKATIITTKGIKMKVWVCSDYGQSVTYKKENTKGASIFKMSKSRIKKIEY